MASALSLGDPVGAPVGASVGVLGRSGALVGPSAGESSSRRRRTGYTFVPRSYGYHPPFTQATQNGILWRPAMSTAREVGELWEKASVMLQLSVKRLGGSP